MEKEIKKQMIKRIEIPEEIESIIEGNKIILKKDSKDLERKMPLGIKVSKEGKEIVIKISKPKRAEKRNLGSAAGHIKNMIEGLMKGFEYELEICNVHFPMTVDLDKSKKEIRINNLLGEKVPRKFGVSDKVEISIKAPKIIIKSYDLEEAGQTAANFEKISRVKNKDRNKFQDGIFITKKPDKGLV